PEAFAEQPRNRAARPRPLHARECPAADTTHPALAVALDAQGDGDLLIRARFGEADQPRDQRREDALTSRDGTAAGEMHFPLHRMQRADLRREIVPGVAEDALVERFSRRRQTM